jgi:hypothetical protein
MVKKKQEPLSWIDVPRETLRPEVGAAYDELQQDNAKIKASRKKFEALFRNSLKLSGKKHLLFAYAAGGLRVAISRLKREKASSETMDFETLIKTVREEEE